jgi:hypothetical protein
MAGVNFTLDSAKRIAASVRKVEAMGGTTDGAANPARSPQIRFYAMLTGCELTGTFWDWVAVVPALPLPSGTISTSIADPNQVNQYSIANSMWNFQQPYVAGFVNAREANGTRDIPPGTVVELSLMGYAVPQTNSATGAAGTITQAGIDPGSVVSADGSIPFYVFCYNLPSQVPYLPIHDHRSNLPEHGGYSFSVYAPGTSLPQQNWSV